MAPQGVQVHAIATRPVISAPEEGSDSEELGAPDHQALLPGKRTPPSAPSDDDDTFTSLDEPDRDFRP